VHVLGEVASPSKSARTIARSDGEIADGETFGTTGGEMAGVSLSFERASSARRMSLQSPSMSHASEDGSAAAT